MSAAQDLCRAFPAELGSVAAARRFVSDAVDGAVAEDDRFALTLAVSELATNALLHAATSFEVAVRQQDCIRIDVTDGDPTPPVQRSAGLSDTSGRGLQLVDQLASRWGVDLRPDGKCVWCEFDLSLDG